MTADEKLRVLVLGSMELADLSSDAEGVSLVDLVASTESAIDHIRHDPPDIVIIDFDLPGEQGIDRLRGVHSNFADVPKIIVVAEQDPVLLSEALGAGAAGVLSSPTVKQIDDAIQVVRAGGSYLDPLRTRIMVDQLGESGAEGKAEQSSSLTNREVEILELLANGMSARQVSSRLKLSERTVNTHVANLYRKLGVSNRVEAVRYAMAHGIVKLPE